MGTRADFYAGKGKDAEWLGSIAFDGHDIGAQIRECTSPEAYRHAVASFLAERDDATLPEQGWPWPWDTSETSDCAYFHFDGRTWRAQGDYRGTSRDDDVYAPCDESYFNDEDEHYAERIAQLERIEYPDMKVRKKVTYGKRSGLIVIEMP